MHMRLSIFGFDPLNKPENKKPNTKPVETNQFVSSKVPAVKKTPKLGLFKNKGLVLLILAALIFFSLLGYVYINKGFNTKIESTKNYDGLPFDKTKYEHGIFVGNVTVYWEDLLRKYNLLYDSNPENWSNLANWKNVINKVTEDAILQNEGVKTNLFAGEDSSRLDPIKITRARNYFDTKGKEYLSGEAITVWFYNDKIPEMGLDPAKKITFDLISEVRSKILANSITMKDGADLISSDFKLSEIDPAYQANAYLKFTYISPEDRVFHDDYVDKLLRDIEVGEVSEVITGHDFKDDSKYDAFYIVLKVNEKTSKEKFPFKSSENVIRKRILEGYKLEL